MLIMRNFVNYLLLISHDRVNEFLSWEVWDQTCPMAKVNDQFAFLHPLFACLRMICVAKMR